jgi:hypothetical protein
MAESEFINYVCYEKIDEAYKVHNRHAGGVKYGDIKHRKYCSISLWEFELRTNEQVIILKYAPN